MSSPPLKKINFHRILAALRWPLDKAQILFLFFGHFLLQKFAPYDRRGPSLKDSKHRHWNASVSCLDSSLAVLVQLSVELLGRFKVK